MTIAYDQLTITVEPAVLPTAVRLCKQDPSLGFDFFDFMAGVDLRDQGFAVDTHLYSLRHRHHITLRAVAPGGREHPRLPSISGIYRGANWHEREAYDMFGVEFEGHPGLLPRILTVENFEGFPLRKEFHLSTRDAKPWPGAKEPEERGHGDEAPATGPEQAATSAEDRAGAAAAKAERAKAKAAAMRARKRAARGGDTQDAAAGIAAAAAGEPQPQTPEGAAAIAGSDVAKDAAAGAVGGDVAAGAPGDRPGAEEPVPDAQAEAEVGAGAPPSASGAPGAEAEGRHGGAVEQSGTKPAAETPGMDPRTDEGASEEGTDR
jgi:NADH-quinone oxidoreductase subunit C